jgi:hypothetical protein
MPELLRVIAILTLGSGEVNTDQAQALLRQSPTMSKAHGARGWEMRATTDLATLLKRFVV